MKNLLFGLIATVLFAFNGNAQEKLTQEDVRLQMATSMSQLVEQCKETYSKEMNYEEFINKTFEGNKIETEAGNNLMKKAYEFLSKGVDNEEIIKGYNGKEMAAVTIIAGFSCSTQNAVVNIFGQDIANSHTGEALIANKGCGWFQWLCDAASWVWAHRKEILEILLLVHWI